MKARRLTHPVCACGQALRSTAAATANFGCFGYSVDLQIEGTIRRGWLHNLIYGHLSPRGPPDRIRSFVVRPCYSGWQFCVDYYTVSHGGRWTMIDSRTQN